MSFRPPYSENMITALKTDWLNADYSPHIDEEIAREQAVVRRVISGAEFPDPAKFTEVVQSACRLAFADDLAAFADDLLLTFGMHQEIVYQSVAKLFYTTCTDTQRAKAVGEELNTAGGIRLMRCAFYAFKWVVAKFLTDMEIEPWYAQVFYIYIEVAWDGVGEWKF